MVKKTETNESKPEKKEHNIKRIMYDKLFGRDPKEVSNDSKLDPKVIKCFIMGFRGMREPEWALDHTDYYGAYDAGVDTANKRK